MKVPITKVDLNENIKDAVGAVLESGWLVQGANVAKFEQMFAEYSGAEYAVAVTSCTTALHLSLEAMGIKRGDRVLLPSFTYVASANSIEQTGAVPVFCDIDLKTFNLSVEKMREIKDIDFIMPVNLFGLCADMVSVSQFASERGIKVIEDSACGLGAYIDGKHSGTFGDAGCFSFHPRKAITTGEGGIVVTNDEEIARKLRVKRDHGASKSDLQRHFEKGGSLLPEFNESGFNYRMTDIQGVIGVCQMAEADGILEKRALLAERYNEALKESSFILPSVPEGYVHGYQSYVLIWNEGRTVDELEKLPISEIEQLNRNRNKFMFELENRGIATRQGTHAVHTLGFYKEKYGLSDEDYKSSFTADRLSFALPLYPSMTDKEFEYVCSNIYEVLNCAE